MGPGRTTTSCEGRATVLGGAFNKSHLRSCLGKLSSLLTNLESVMEVTSRHLVGVQVPVSSEDIIYLVRM